MGWKWQDPISVRNAEACYQGPNQDAVGEKVYLNVELVQSSQKNAPLSGANGVVYNQPATKFLFVFHQGMTLHYRLEVVSVSSLGTGIQQESIWISVARRSSCCVFRHCLHFYHCSCYCWVVCGVTEEGQPFSAESSYQLLSVFVWWALLGRDYCAVSTTSIVLTPMGISPYASLLSFFLLVPGQTSAVTYPYPRVSPLSYLDHSLLHTEWVVGPSLKLCWNDFFSLVSVIPTRGVAIWKQSIFSLHQNSELTDFCVQPEMHSHCLPWRPLWVTAVIRWGCIASWEMTDLDAGYVMLWVCTSAQWQSLYPQTPVSRSICTLRHS